MKNKHFLILEKASSKLEISNDNNDVIYLEGVFTEFNVRNRNNRIYDASDFLPKLEELRPRVENHTLLGELDHPSNFDVSLQNASHVIEDLRYDKDRNCVIGKIRLLNTRAGKDAQALVKDGIPLHISSRAAGNVDANGKVTINQIFTYDLVADPGFASAELHQVSESYTFNGTKEEQKKCLNGLFGLENNPDVRIYECEYNENETKKEYNINGNMNKENVTVENFQKYTEYISNVIEGVKESVNELKEQLNNGVADKSVGEKINRLEKYSNYLAEQLEKTQNHSDYLAEKLEQSYNHNDYLAEEIEKTQNHNDYLAEQLENAVKYSEYVAENVDNNIQYSQYLSEQLDKNFAHNDYLAEQLENNFNHNDYLAEKLEQNYNHNDYLAEKLEQNYKHNDYLAEKLEQNFAHNDYLAEKLNGNFAHNDYLAEQLENNFKHNDYLAEKLEQNYKHNNYLAEQLENSVNNVNMVNENKVAQNNVMINETKVNKPSANEKYMSSITEKLDALINSVSEQVPENNFMNLLSESRQNEYSSLDEDTQKLIAEAMNVAKVKNEAQANVVWKSVYESKKGLDIVENMPEACKSKWNTLSDNRKNEILNEAKFYNLKSQNEIDYFWNTRDLREKQLVTERVDTDSAKMWNTNTDEQSKYISNILGKTQRNLRGW